ncbi:chromosome segregation protein [Blastomyces gilchristii SLH14081]|uniref:Chromosome segregation protein n=1 Tax=Blastomyces gilchristii (strain SLH14081) TaxID=559298 RepID=A0A179UX67_BLAGS|nr:chromosome segregation protein [Blastomyces gilchristii SLH14081]OAT11708.1 chromosome segregation protein [Blastomyces gilchristii SLH14081]
MPKRKAASKLSGLVDDDLEDDLLMNGGGEHTHDEATDTAPPPTKRARPGRPRSAAAKATTAAKPSTRKARSTVIVGPKRGRPARGTTTRRGRKSLGDTEEAHETVDTSFSKESDQEKYLDDEPQPEPEQPSHDELNSPETTAHGGTRAGGRTKTGAQQKKAPGKRVTIDDGFEYTPMGSRHPKPSKQPTEEKPAIKPVTRRKKPEVEPEIEEQQQEEVEEEEEEEEEEEGEETEEAEQAEEPALPETHYLPARSISRSPIKGPANGHLQYKTPQTANQRRKATGAVSDLEKGDSEATLRRKLGDMAKKYENMDMKYRNLREVGILEANSNVEKLRKQCEANTAASNELIASLKKELATQTTLAKESRTLQKQLQDRDDEVAELEAKIKHLNSGLTDAQNEIKALQMKLAASRTAATNLECVTGSKGPGSAAKVNSGGVSRSIMGSAEAAHAAQIAQLKEDLYSDLTGLIIRDARKRESDHLYDCIQTGMNGTLHFKLAVAHDLENTSFEAAEFHYFPLLDPNRDRDLVDILPEYLSIDITFPRQHASVFYSRVVDTLTKKSRRTDD